MRKLTRSYTFAFALGLTAALLVAEIIAQPSFISPGNWADELGTFAPFAILAMASTPSILSGGGGLDISVGPLATLVNCVFVAWLLPHGLGGVVAIPIILAIGVGLGAFNGFLVAVLRFQPVIATLCMYFVFAGLADKIAATPAPAPSNWTDHLAHSIGFFPGAVITIAVPILIWVALQRTAFRRTLLAVGASDTSAFSAGMNVTALRVGAYALGGLFASIGGLALTALIQTSAAALSTEYALVALAAVALGGTPLGGGRGGLLGSLLGASAIYMIQQLLSSAGVSANYLQLVYGVLLIVGIVISARASAPLRTAVA